MRRFDTAHRQRMRQRRLRLADIRRNYHAQPISNGERAEGRNPGTLLLTMALAFVAIAVANSARKHNSPSVVPVVADLAMAPEVRNEMSSSLAANTPPRHRGLAKTNPYLADMPNRTDQPLRFDAPAVQRSAETELMANSPWSQSSSTKESGPKDAKDQSPTSTASPMPKDAPKSLEPTESPTPIGGDFHNTPTLAKSPSNDDLEVLEPIVDNHAEIDDDANRSLKLLLTPEFPEDKNAVSNEMPLPSPNLPTRIEDVDVGEQKIQGTAELPLLDVTRQLLGD